MTHVLNDDTKKKILEQIPMGTIGEGADVAAAVRFLLSEEAKYITGHTISVNGGMFMG